MEVTEQKRERRKAIQIGSIAVFSYLACYYMRHLLSVTTPLMTNEGASTKEVLGTLSSFYMLAYAVGQLLNGIVGDRLKAKYMVSVGLAVSGISSICFPFASHIVLQILCFVVMGFSLSMLRGPLVKTISENTTPAYARICCTFFSFASFFGPLISSGLAIFLRWQGVFIVAGSAVFIIAIFAFFVFSLMEKRGVIHFHSVKTEKIRFRDIFKVFRLENFGLYMIVGALVEISAASIGFWIPTYMNEALGFTEEFSNIIFSVMTVIRATVPFLALGVFRLFKHRQFPMLTMSFALSALFFAGLLFFKQPIVNIVLFLLALMSVSLASALLWSIYIPSQAKSGMVSTLNGVLDFSGYAVSFLANLVFTFSMSHIGWDGLIIMWASMMLFGVLSALVQARRKKGAQEALDT